MKSFSSIFEYEWKDAFDVLVGGQFNLVLICMNTGFFGTILDTLNNENKHGSSISCARFTTTVYFIKQNWKILNLKQCISVFRRSQTLTIVK